MTELIAFARAAGMATVRLDTARQCREALGLFHSFGFVEIPAYKQSIGDCFMALDLSAPPTRQP